MKNTYIILLGLTLAIFAGCSEDEYTAPNPELSDVTWYTGINPGTPAVRSVGEYVSFLDASQGALSHEWIIEDGSKFLTNTFRPGDDLTKFIDESAGLKSTESTVHVLFRKPGINKITLRNTFSQPVVYQGTPEVSSVPSDGVHLFENTFEIDVYDRLLPAFKVFQGDEEILNITETDFPLEEDEANWPEVTIEAGSLITYVDMTTYDRPNARAWELTNGAPTMSSDSIINVAYFKLGKTNAGSFRSIRNGNLPNQNVLKLIPLKFNVIPSTDPFLLDETFEVVELKDEKIVISLTGEAQIPVAQQGNFTVNVKNANGFDQNIAVRVVSIDPSDATKLVLELEAPIYNSDSLEVSFANGAITSVDSRTLQDFGPVPVVSYVENLYPTDIAGFEASQPQWTHEAWAQGPTHSFASAPSPVFEGDFSMRLEAVTTGAVFTSNKVTLIKYNPGKKHAWSYKLWIDPSSTATAFGNIRNPPWQNRDIQIGGFPKGEWVDSGEIVFTDATEDFHIHIQMFNNDGSGNFGSGSLIVYIDNLLVYELEERP